MDKLGGGLVDVSSGNIPIVQGTLGHNIIFDFTEKYPENTLVWLGNTNIWDYASVNWYDTNTKKTGSWNELIEYSDLKNIYFGKIRNSENKHIILDDDFEIYRDLIIADSGYIFVGEKSLFIQGDVYFNAETIFNHINIQQVTGDVYVNADITFNDSYIEHVNRAIVSDNGATITMDNSSINKGNICHGVNFNLTDSTIDNIAIELNIPLLKAFSYNNIVDSNRFEIGYIDISESENKDNLISLNGYDAEGNSAVSITKGINFGILYYLWKDGYSYCPVYSDYCLIKLAPTNRKFELIVDVDDEQLTSKEMLQETVLGRYFLINPVDTDTNIYDLIDTTYIDALKTKLNAAWQKYGDNKDEYFMCNLYYEDGSLVLDIVKRDPTAIEW